MDNYYSRVKMQEVVIEASQLVAQSGINEAMDILSYFTIAITMTIVVVYLWEWMQ